jgi:hypothetical protein
MWQSRTCAASSHQEMRYDECWKLSPRLGSPYSAIGPASRRICLSNRGRRAALPTACSRGIVQDFARRIGSVPPIAVRSFLARDTTGRPRHGGEAFWADLLVTLDADSKAGVVNPSQCCLHLAQQVGITIHVSDRKIALLRKTRASSTSFRSKICWNASVLARDVFMAVPFPLGLRMVLCTGGSSTKPRRSGI